nr:FAD-dependent oxidoreductase [Burkholderia sp. Ax-1719]
MEAKVRERSVDVVISGAGAAGLTLAIELARRGVTFCLCDKLEAPFGGSRGKGIQPRTLEIFEDLGVLDRMLLAGGPYPPERKYRDDGSYGEAQALVTEAPTPSEPYVAPLLVAQFRSEAVLRERLAELGHSVRYGCELIGIEQDENGVVAHVVDPAGEQTIRAQFLVGADGGRSFVRNVMAIGFPGKTLGVRAVVADVFLSGLDRDVWHRFNEGSMERQIALCPLIGTTMFQLQAPVPLDGDVDLSAEGLAAMIKARTGRDDIHIESVSWASAYTMNARLADRYRDRRLLLVGDAAHIHPPTGGQGLNTSVQDACNLGWKLAAVIDGAPDRLLDSYEAERRPVAADMLGLTTRLLDAMKQGDNRRGREVRQLDIGYVDSTLALERPQRHAGPRAGERAPDAPIRRASGHPARLFDLLKGAHWTLIGYGVDRERVTPRAGLRIHTFGTAGDIVDDCGHFNDAYAMEQGDWVLVRPDGYIGAILSSENLESLERYLENVGVGRLQCAAYVSAS